MNEWMNGALGHLCAHTIFEIRALVSWGQARYLSATRELRHDRPSGLKAKSWYSPHDAVVLWWPDI